MLLSREHLDFELSGPFGYGRSLHARSLVGDFLTGAPFTLPVDVSLADAAARILARDPETRYHDVLVVGGPTPAVVGVSDIFQRLAEMFRHAAFHDPLTTLPNRRLLDQQAVDFTAAGRDLTRIAILYIDLDGFKMVNDAFGHRAGDEILVSFAARLRASVRTGDVVARLGGDEFAALVVDVSEDQAMAVAERVLLNASTPFVLDGQVLHLSASVGVAMADDIGNEHTDLGQLDALLRLADGAMLHAKQSGKRRAERIPAGGAGRKLERRAVIRRQLESALNRNEGFTLQYQPQLDLSTGDMRSVEALLRWTDPGLGAVSPEEFIPIAEESDQIHRIGAWVLDHACAQAREWLERDQPRTISINVAPAELSKPTLASDVERALAAHRVPAHLLRIEITETSAITDLSATLDQLRRLRAAGIAIELDDFGAGYSSISMLRDLPLSAVKIDRSFIDSIDTDTRSAALVKGVFEAAHALGLTVTAEGVERPEQLLMLRRLDCDMAQGFLIARPVAAAHLI